jgi:hypothetical protein
LGDNIKNKNRFRKPLLKGEDNYEKARVTTCFWKDLKFHLFLWVVLLFEPVFVSYLESRDQDPFVTGKTERLGW